MARVLRRLLGVVGLSLAVYWGVEANNCSVAPLILALENNTLPDGIALNRGVACSLGGQVQGFRLNFARNNSGIRNARDCEGAGSPANVSRCIGASGGVFSIPNSTTFSAAPNGAWNVTNIDPFPNGAHIIRGYDTATFAGHVRVPNFPFEVWSDVKSANRSSLGMGISSSVLKSLLNADAIPSPEMGLFLGSRSMSSPLDGEIVFGGYNEARVNGSFYEFPINAGYLRDPCPLQVLLKDVVVSSANGTRTSIMPDPGARVPACINPVENAFQFTRKMYGAWATLTQHPVNPPLDGSKNFSDQTFPLESERHMSELTITLEGGYEVVIPHYELVNFERGNNAQGLYDVVNTSRVMAAVTVGDIFDFPLLGGVFLSQSYLRVDYAKKVFGLAHAVQGPIDPLAGKIVSTCVQPNTSAPQPSNTTSTSKSTSKPVPNELSGGAIAGTVVGSVFGALLLSLLGIILWRKHRKQNFLQTASPPERQQPQMRRMQQSPAELPSPTSEGTMALPVRESIVVGGTPEEVKNHVIYA
ncbi:MAG: hypothetical protein M1840_006158 [Geoglossum simile]|nr:MAG: hypothetical protein M1840_006158 [Geoglossum simile]